MKTNEAPAEIYILPDERNPNGLSICWYEAPYSTGAVEYTRTDAFIDKVCDWLSDTLQTVVDVDIPPVHHVESLPSLGIITQTEFIEKFKKEIMFLLD